jgi:hypothetical protein
MIPVTAPAARRLFIPLLADFCRSRFGRGGKLTEKWNEIGLFAASKYAVALMPPWGPATVRNDSRHRERIPPYFFLAAATSAALAPSNDHVPMIFFQ